jgi:hypothetical protein
MNAVFMYFQIYRRGKFLYLSYSVVDPAMQVFTEMLHGQRADHTEPSIGQSP